MSALVMNGRFPQFRTIEKLGVRGSWDKPAGFCLINLAVCNCLCYLWCELEWGGYSMIIRMYLLLCCPLCIHMLPLSYIGQVSCTLLFFFELKYHTSAFKCFILPGTPKKESFFSWAKRCARLFYMHFVTCLCLYHSIIWLQRGFIKLAENVHN